jgi:hypothetical protein
MRRAFGVFLLAFAACDVERDLSRELFACGRGGPCDGADGGTGGRDAEPRDAEVVPCDPTFGPNAEGGQVEGRWRYVSACSTRYVVEDYINGCPGSARRMQELVVTGDLTIGPDALSNTCVVTWTESFYIAGGVCIPPPNDCDTLTELIRSMSFNGTGGCTESGNGCECMITGSSACLPGGEYTITGATMCVETYDFRFTAGGESLIYVPVEEDFYQRKIVFVTEKAR